MVLRDDYATNGIFGGKACCKCVESGSSTPSTDNPPGTCNGDAEYLQSIPTPEEIAALIDGGGSRYDEIVLGHGA